ncbi:MAG: hypothetical protein PWQ77_1493 [Kosmotogales bacterium]|nr:hypothetical protein [Kosmotogales bacterium]
MNKKRELYNLVQWCKSKGFSKEETLENVKHSFGNIKENDFILMWASERDLYHEIEKFDIKKRLKIVILILIALLITISGIIFHVISGPVYVKYNDEIVMSFDLPIQSDTSEKPFIIEKEGNKYEITPLKEYTLSGLVISKRSYSDYGSRLVPYDFLFVWGELIEEDNRKGIDFWQNNRWYYFRINASKWNLDFIQNRSANVHLLPKNENILKTLQFVPKYEKAVFIGKLISIRGIDDNFSWKSSLSRSDAGDGACELMYVEKIIVGDKLYE